MKAFMHSAALVTACPLLFALPVQAAVVFTNTTLFNEGFTVSNNDLAQTSIASIQTQGVFTEFNSAGAPVLNDGSFGAVGSAFGATALTGGGASITFNFNTAQNIGEIATYSGWDQFRGGQSYIVSYATATDPLNFVFLASVFNNSVGGFSENVSTRAVITHTSGTLASNVASVRFAFNGDLLFGPAGYREIDIFAAQPAVTPGPAVVPEPATWGLMIAGFGLIGAVQRLARRRRAWPIA